MPHYFLQAAFNFSTWNKRCNADFALSRVRTPQPDAQTKRLYGWTENIHFSSKHQSYFNATVWIYWNYRKITINMLLKDNWWPFYKKKQHASGFRHLNTICYQLLFLFYLNDFIFFILLCLQLEWTECINSTITFSLDTICSPGRIMEVVWFGSHHYNVLEVTPCQHWTVKINHKMAVLYSGIFL